MFANNSKSRATGVKGCCRHREDWRALVSASGALWLLVLYLTRLAFGRLPVLRNFGARVRHMPFTEYACACGCVGGYDTMEDADQWGKDNGEALKDLDHDDHSYAWEYRDYIKDKWMDMLDDFQRGEARHRVRRHVQWRALDPARLRT